ncbi:MAG: MaoC/PaaZ C-terminal domain-containing protein [Actinomycetes bacterium]
MPLPSSAVGRATESFDHFVDARWIMAYAAGIGDLNTRYSDTSSPIGIVTHPLFPVCLEWPVVLAARDLVARSMLPIAERIRGVHASHEVQIVRLARPGELLRTTAVVEGIEKRTPGAYEVLRLDTVDAVGDIVFSTRMGSIFLGVSVEGIDRPAPAEIAAPMVVASHRQQTVGVTQQTRWHQHIGAQAAHIYTECARIWNPIHTDVVTAQAAGLPGIILHGTAFLAMAVSRIVDEFADGDPARVRRIAGRFGAMVMMPSTITIEITECRQRQRGVIGSLELEVWFEVRNGQGDPAVRSGVVVIDQS